MICFLLNTNCTNRTNLCTRFASAVGSAECMRGTIASEASDIVFKFAFRFVLTKETNVWIINQRDDTEFRPVFASRYALNN